MAAQVLFVCLGNICRSPTAHGVFQYCVDQAGMNKEIEVDSAGTGAWHIGQPPDQRAMATALARGYDLSSQRARQLEVGDFDRFDHILAMDRKNLLHMRALQPATYGGYLGCLLDFHPRAPVFDVPDPYYGGSDGFDEVLDLVEDACQGLLQAVSNS